MIGLIATLVNIRGPVFLSERHLTVEFVSVYWILDMYFFS